MPNQACLRRVRLTVMGAVFAAAPLGGFAQGIFGGGLSWVGDRTGIAALQKAGRELDNASRDLKQRAPVVAVVGTMMVAPGLGHVIAAKEHPKETMAVGLAALSLAVACVDGCSTAISALAGTAGGTVAVPILDSKRSSSAPSQPRPSPNVSAPGEPSPVKRGDSTELDHTTLRRDRGADSVRRTDQAKKSSVKAPTSPEPRTQEQANQDPLRHVQIPPLDSSTSARRSNDSGRYRAGPNLGDPWFEVTPSVSIQGAAGRWLPMAKWDAHHGKVSLSDFTINPVVPITPYVSFEMSLATTGPRSFSVTIQDPTGMLGGVSVGTNLGAGPNLMLDARLFNLTGGVMIQPGAGWDNAVGQLGSSVIDLYKACPPEVSCQ